MAAKPVSLANCDGRTKPFYRLLRNNLYYKNYKDAPALKHLNLVAIGILTFAMYVELRWLLG